MQIHTTHCCGVRELSGVQEDGSARDKLMSVVEGLLGQYDCAFAFFAQNSENGNDGGLEFGRYIMEHELGDIYETDWALNPNSGNEIKVFMWQVELGGLSGWFQEQQELDRQQAERERLQALPTARADRHQRINAVAGVEGTQVLVGSAVNHTQYGMGVVQAVRRNARATIGVEFLVQPNGGHNLNESIDRNYGKWVTPENISVIG